LTFWYQIANYVFLMKAYLSLHGIGLFSGQYFGWAGSCSGQVIRFQSPYFAPEILTDPSYHKRLVIADTESFENRWPMPEDCQSFMPHLAGLVLLGNPIESEKEDSHFTLKNYLATNHICGFIPDQSELLRDTLNLASETTGYIDREKSRAETHLAQQLEYPKIDLGQISSPQEYFWDLAPGPMPSEEINIIIWDFGVTYGILRDLRKLGCRLRVMPPATSPEDIIALHPDGIIIAGGPLDTDTLLKVSHPAERIAGIRPTLGIGSGALILAKSLGIVPVQLERNHFGAAIAVEDYRGQVVATYQAHSMTFNRTSLAKAGAQITHLNVADGSIEGFWHEELSAAGTLFSMTAEETPAHLQSFVKNIDKAFYRA
jgi:carbamoyl-phosphate synthase small subunit